MSEHKLEGADLKKMVMLGKKKVLSFAFCPGPKNEHTMLIDRRKGPEMLGKLARKEGEGNKVGFGTFEVKGRVMEMTCGRTVPQMAKTIKKYLKTQKVQINIVILDMDGNPLESDVEDLPPDPTMEEPNDVQASTETDAEAPEKAEDVSNDPAALVARLKALQPSIAAASGGAGDKLKKVAAAAVAFIKSSDFDKAEKAIAGLEAAVAKLDQSTPQTNDATPPPEQDMSAFATRAKALHEAISDINGPAKGKLEKALAVTVEKIKAQDATAAEALLTKLETALKKVGASNRSETPDQESPPGLTPESLNTLRDSWMATFANMRQDVDTLKSAIETATTGIDGLQGIPAKSAVLFTYLDEIDGGLEQTLQKMANAQDDNARTELRNAALKIVENYKGVLDKGFFKDVDNNGFVKTNIRSSALKSLKQVSSALSA